MTGGYTVTRRVAFGSRCARAQGTRAAPAEAGATAEDAGAVQRATRLMALALRFESLLRDGAVADQAELARLARVSRARVTQILNLTLLAPDIQEALLTLPRITRGRDRVTEKTLRSIASEVDWDRQRALWKGLSASES